MMGRVVWLCVVLALLALSVSVGAIVWGGVRRFKTGETFDGQNAYADTVPAKASGVLDCKLVPSIMMPGDAYGDRMAACAETCAGGDMGYYTLAKGDVAAAEGQASMCQCCDPASSVKLALETSAPGTCLSDETFGVDDTVRSMYVKGGCAGIFKWADGREVSCSSANISPGTRSRAMCSYNPAGGSLQLIEDNIQEATLQEAVHNSDVAAALAAQQKLEAEEVAYSGALDAMAAARASPF